MATTDLQATERDLSAMYRAFDDGRKYKGVPAQERLEEYALSISTKVTDEGTSVHIDLPFGWLECQMEKIGPRKWQLGTVRHHSSIYPEHDVVEAVDEDSFSYRFADDYADVDQ